MNIVTNQIPTHRKKEIVDRLHALNNTIEHPARTVVIYARDSTEEQDVLTQLRECFEFCTRKQFTIATIYIDVGVSGRSLNKPAQRQLRNDALAQKFDTIVVWELSRITRLGAKSLLDFFYIMDEANVSILSVNEPIINTENTLVRDIVLAVLGAVSKDESDRISRRVSSGISRRRAEGKQVGASTKAVSIDELCAIHTKNPGWGWRRITDEYNKNRRGHNRISWATVRTRILNEIREGTKNE